MTTKKKLENKLITLDQIIQSAYLKTKTIFQSVRETQNLSLEHVLIESTNYSRGVNSRSENFINQVFTEQEQIILRALQNQNLELQSWGTPRLWGNLELPINKIPPEFLRIGDLLPGNLCGKLPQMPAIIPLLKSNHILAFHPRRLVDIGAALLSSIMWRVVAFTSPEKYKITIIDTINRGRSFASFLSLPESIRGGKIYCQPREIEEILQKALNDMENVIQQRLGQKYDTIEDYNAANPQLALPYHFLVMASFPEGFSDMSEDLLISLAHTGIRAGYYLVGGVISQEIHQTRFGNAISRLMEQSTCISINENEVVSWDDPLFAHVPVKLDICPSRDLIEYISLLVDDALGKISDVVEFAKYMPEISDWMRCSSQMGLSAAIGIDQSGKIFTVDLGPISDTFHAIVGGRIHSGKTNFLHALILSLCLKYSEEELELYLVDFKEGVEFQDYAINRLPHARAIVIEAEREFGLSILEYLNEEMERRSEEFKLLGVNVVNIESFRAQTNKSMPRIVAIMDEFVKLFEEDDYISDRAYQLLLNIVQRSRAFGIHLVLAAQRPVGNYQNLNSVKSQVGLRIAFKCNEPDDSMLILGERNEKAAYLERNGLAYLTYDPTLPDRSIQVKVSYVDPEERKLYLEGISRLCKKRNPSYRWNAVVFRKWEPIYWQNTLSISKYLEKENSVWLGQPVRLAEDQIIRVVDQESENVSLLGGNDQLAFQTLIHALLSLSLTTHPDGAEFYWVTVPNSHPDSDAYTQAIKKIIPHDFEIATCADINYLLSELVKRLERRILNSDKKSQIYFFIPGIHRIREFRNADSLEDSQPSDLLNRILQDGPQAGVHSILWADRYDTLRNMTTSNIFDNFAHRIAFHMSNDDSNYYLGVSDASRLGMDKRLLYRNQNWSERAVIKIKPYELPSISEFLELVTIIKRRWE